MGLFILRLAEDGPALKDGRIHVSGSVAAQLKLRLRRWGAQLGFVLPYLRLVLIFRVPVLNSEAFLLRLVLRFFD